MNLLSDDDIERMTKDEILMVLRRLVLDWQQSVGEIESHCNTIERLNEELRRSNAQLREHIQVMHDGIAKAQIERDAAQKLYRDLAVEYNMRADELHAVRRQLSELRSK